MAAEIQVKTATASTTVTELWQRPFKLISNGIFVTVTPSDADVYVTSGKLVNKQITHFMNWGYVVTFSNSLTAQAQTIPADPNKVSTTSSDIYNVNDTGFTWKILYSFVEYTLPDGTMPTISIRYDNKTGTFIANRPCYAAIRINPHLAETANYTYIPSSAMLNGMYTVTYGMAYAILKYTGNPAIHDPDKHQITTCDIPAPAAVPSETGKYEQYRMTMPVVTTDQGDWHMPKNFTSDNYDPANAYGPGIAGPSKDNGWVQKDVPIEIGHTSESGTTFTRNPLPSLQGPAMPVMPLTMHISDKPAEIATPTVNTPGQSDPWNSGVGFAQERMAKYEPVYGAVNQATNSYSDIQPTPTA